MKQRSVDACESQLHPVVVRYPAPVPFDLVARDITARGIRTRIVEAGSGPPIVLIHGFLSNHHAYDDVVPSLAGAFRVVALDLPGFGDSEKPPPTHHPYTVEAFAEVVTDVIAALELGRCHVVGHAIGGSVALTLAAQHPEFVDHLALIAPHLYPTSLPIQTRILMMPVLGNILFKQVLGRSTFRSYFQKQMYAPGHDVPTSRIDHYFDAFRTPAGRESANAVMKCMADMRPSIARLARIKAPTLVMWGRADAVSSPQVAQRITRQLQSAQLEMIDSGHSPHEEHPDRFVATLERFLHNQRR